MFVKRVKNRIWNSIVSKLRKKKYYQQIYGSYWHVRWNQDKFPNSSLNYYAAIPNPGAGIGHQMANWIAGYWFSQKFGLHFAHSPFLKANWDFFLGFGQGEKKIDELISKGYKKVRLPLFDEENLAEIELQQKIIRSYSHKKVVFVAEQDQFYRDQFGVLDTLVKKFHSAPARNGNKLIFDATSYNIAIHVRRGDIVLGKETKNDNLLMRWQENDYFENVLKKLLQNLETPKPIAIYLFSQGIESDFPEFTHLRNLHFCLDMNAQDSFLHMVYADCLITSKSSFSYKPALLNKGTKVCPKDFWHGYPKTKDWMIAQEDGTIETHVNE